MYSTEKQRTKTTVTNWREKPRVPDNVGPPISNWREPRKDPKSIFGNSTELRDARIAGYSAKRRATEEDLESFFQYRKSYSKSPSWTLPEVSTIYSSQGYEFEQFQKIKEEVRNVKKEVFDKHSQQKWKTISDELTLCLFLRKSLKAKNFELPSSSWCKAFEIFKSFPLIKSGKVNSAHIVDHCGFFISSLNHYLHSTYSVDEIDWKWRAISYNPYCEDNICTTRYDDRLLSETFKNWCFGMDFTGDIMNQDNIDYFVKECQSIGEINLAITSATQGFNVDLENVEFNTFDISFAGMVVALKVLSNGGNLVMTSFTVLSSVKVSLIYFLNLVFEEVHMYKPATGPLSSFEFYIVCMNFKKNDQVEDYLEAMKLRVGFGSWDKGPLFSQEAIPRSFLLQHQDVMIFFQKNWEKFIGELTFFYENPGNHFTKRWAEKRKLLASFFLEKFDVNPLPVDKRLIKSSDNTEIKRVRVEREFNKNEGCSISIEHLQSFDDILLCDQLSLLFEKFKNIQELLEWPHDTNAVSLKNLPTVNLIPEYGKPVERVRRTIFIMPSFLYLYVGQIEAKYGKCIVEYFPQHQISCTFDGQNVISYKFHTNYGESEKGFLRNIFKMWSKLKPKTIVFKNFLFITHFSASFLRTISSFYEFITLSVEGCIELQSFKNQEWIPKIANELCEYLNGESCNFIMCFTEFKEVNKGLFFEALVTFNSQLLMVYLVKAFDALVTDSLSNLKL